MDDVEQFAASLSRLQQKREMCLIELDWATAVCVVSSCQLALRHAGLPPGVRDLVRAFADRVVQRIDSMDSELGRVMRIGDPAPLDE